MFPRLAPLLMLGLSLAALPLATKQESADVAPAAATKSHAGVVRASRIATLSAEVPGRVVARPLEEHAAVAQNGLLVGIESRPYAADVKAAEADVLDARAESELAAKELKRTRELARRDVSADRELDAAHTRQRRAEATVLRAEAALERARFRLERCRIDAPFAGAITRIMVEVGEYLRTGDPLVTLIATDVVEIESFLEAGEATALRPGQAIVLEGFKDVDARVRSIAPGSDNAARTFKVVIAAENPPAPAPPRLRPGMLLRWSLRP